MILFLKDQDLIFIVFVRILLNIIISNAHHCIGYFPSYLTKGGERHNILRVIEIKNKWFSSYCFPFFLYYLGHEQISYKGKTRRFIREGKNLLQERAYMLSSPLITRFSFHISLPKPETINMLLPFEKRKGCFQKKGKNFKEAPLQVVFTGHSVWFKDPVISVFKFHFFPAFQFFDCIKLLLEEDSRRLSFIASKRDERRDVFQFTRDLAVLVFGFQFFFPTFQFFHCIVERGSKDFSFYWKGTNTF